MAIKSPFKLLAILFILTGSSFAQSEGTVRGSVFHSGAWWSATWSGSGLMGVGTYPPSTIAISSVGANIFTGDVSGTSTGGTANLTLSGTISNQIRFSGNLLADNLFIGGGNLQIFSGSIGSGGIVSQVVNDNLSSSVTLLWPDEGSQNHTIATQEWTGSNFALISGTVNPPSGTTIPAAWGTFQVSGTTFKIPLYQ